MKRCKVLFKVSPSSGRNALCVPSNIVLHYFLCTQTTAFCAQERNFTLHWHRPGQVSPVSLQPDNLAIRLDTRYA